MSESKFVERRQKKNKEARGFRRVFRWVADLERFIDRPWYLPVLWLMAASDLFLVVVPMDGIFISTVMLRRKRWLKTALWIATGTAAGSLGLGLVVNHYGAPFIVRLTGALISPHAWERTSVFVDAHGALALGLVALGPFPIIPGVILAAAAQLPIPILVLSVLLGRGLKNVLMAWAATHAPGLLSKLWRVRWEVRSIERAASTEIKNVLRNVTKLDGKVVGEKRKS